MRTSFLSLACLLTVFVCQAQRKSTSDLLPYDEETTIQASLDSTTAIDGEMYQDTLPPAERVLEMDRTQKSKQQAADRRWSARSSSARRNEE